MDASGQLHAPAALLPGKTPGTHWIGGWIWEKRKSPLPLPGLEPRPVEHVASSYTDYSVRLTRVTDTLNEDLQEF